MSKLNGAKHAAAKSGGKARHARPSSSRKYIVGGAGLALCLAISIPFVVTSIAPVNSSVQLAAVESATTSSNNTDGTQSASAQLPATTEESTVAQDATAETVDASESVDAQEAPSTDSAEQDGQEGQDASEPQDMQLESDSAEGADEADAQEAEAVDAANEGSVFAQAQALVQGGQTNPDNEQGDAPEGAEAGANSNEAPEGADNQALDTFSVMAKSAYTDAYSEDIGFFSSVIENGSPIDADIAYNLGTQSVTHTQGVTETLQEGVLDAGCEIISLTVALRSMGVDADPVAIADCYLDMNGNFADGYVGNPYSGGGGFPVGIARMANAYLSDTRPDLHAYDLTGNSFDTLIGLVQRGYPVLVWTTTDFKDPYKSGTFQGDYEWYLNEHCVVLCGVSGDNVIVNDSLEGLVERDAAQFADIFEKCGSMALYVR